MKFTVVFVIVALILIKLLPYREDFTIVERTESTYIRKIDTLQIERRTVVDSLVTLISSYGIRYPKVVLAQMVHETNWFQSNIFKDCLNPFGMKYNNRGYAKRKCRGHAGYDNIADALMDYKIWQDRCLSKVNVRNEQEYIEMLDNLPLCKGCRYAEDPAYTKKIKKYLLTLNQI